MAYIYKMLCSTFLALALIGCSPKLTTGELTEVVKTSIEDEVASYGATVQSLRLTHKSGNIYSGILETNEPNGEFTYTVEVIYDGENFQWEIIP